jgi:poly-beta-1,6-N-acetyl-D-glucosamine synthase
MTPSATHSPVQTSSAPSRRYAIIAPCRDEAKFMRRTLDTVLGQSVPPTTFIIVDDGSTDETPKILAEYAAKHPCMRIVTRENRGKRKVGPGVIEAFYAGYRTIQHEIEQGGSEQGGYDYICKLDLDLQLPPRYFEILMQRMEANPRLGTCSGKAYMPIDPEVVDGDFATTYVSEFLGDETSAGMTKFFRVACFRQIGGFVRQVMWDGIDCHRCRMLGWIAQSWDEPDLRFKHLRPMGSSHKGIFTGRMRHGFGQWFMGTSLPYMTASAIFRMTKKPYLIGGAAMWWGYVRSMLTGAPRLEDPPFRAFVRKWQWASLFKGKAKATAELDASQAREWSLSRASLPMPIEA